MELARVLRFPAGALRWRHLQHGALDAGNPPAGAPRTRLIASYKTLFGNGAFNCYLLMLIGGLAGIAVFEACSGVLMGAVLGLSSMVVSILFILPIPAAFFGARFAGRPNKRFSTLMWQSVICCLLAGLMMWIPGWFGVMNVWTLLIPAALFFFGAGMLFPLATSGAMEPFPFSQAPLARWSAGCKILVPAYWRGFRQCCRKPVRAVWDC